MFPPFDERKAHDYCCKMMEQLEAARNTKNSDDSALYNFTGMFGVLVCNDQNGNEIVLKAFSGSCGGKWNRDGFVPPLFDEEKYNQIISVNDREIHLLSEAQPYETEQEAHERKEKRLRLCNETLSGLYSLYQFYCADGKVRDFASISNGKLLPTGTGDCCAPKLLSYAYSKNLRPVSLAEFYWGKSNTRLTAKTFYPPCDEKCALILPAILGLEIIYRDSDIVVVNKPSGLLSVPGRGADKQDCVVTRLKRLFPECIEQPSVHRLDMDTSGLLVLALNAASHRALSIQFQDGKIEKEYVAVLDGIPNNDALGIDARTRCGRIELKFRVDIENRPHQIYDEVYGKLGITLWERLRIWNMGGRTVTSMKFVPLTGRTHQLRLAASSWRGLNAPIIGDNLYGTQLEGERLMLHARCLSFFHPVTGERLSFVKEPDFKY